MPGLKSALRLAQKKITDSEHEYCHEPTKKNDLVSMQDQQFMYLALTETCRP